MKGMVRNGHMHDTVRVCDNCWVRIDSWEELYEHCYEKRHCKCGSEEKVPETAWAHPYFRSLHDPSPRSEEHTSELQSHSDLVCRLLLEKKKQIETTSHPTSP